MGVKKKKKIEARMNASVLKQDPNTEKIQKNTYLWGHKHTVGTFWCNPLCQATRQHLNNS